MRQTPQDAAERLLARWACRLVQLDGSGHKPPSPGNENLTMITHLTGECGVGALEVRLCCAVPSPK